MNSGPIKFVCNMNVVPEELPHFWEHTVGSGHATLGLRADWQEQLEKCRRDLGFRHVRFHGILSDDMGTLTCQNDKLVYSFFNADQVIDFLLSIGMRPFLELSFMPRTLSSGSTTVFNYQANVTPPKDFDAWGTLIRKLASHWVDRFGVDEVEHWFFEVWNEPNLKAFWTGSQADYFGLFKVTAEALRSVDKNLKIGGPATANNGWLSEFFDFCRSNDIPLDFVSTHHYPTDAFGKPGDDTKAQLAASHRSVLREEAMKAKKEVGAKPLYYTEWSTSSNPFDEFHDEPYAAAFILKTVLEARGLVEGYSYWIFSDIFEENYFSSSPFHGGFGLQTIHGIAKPAYRAYELLHSLGNKIHKVEGRHETVDTWVCSDEEKIQILMTNGALPGHPIQTEMARVILQTDKKAKASYIQRIDDDHSNPKRAWIEMGRPDYLLPHQVSNLEALSVLRKQPIEMTEAGDHVTLNISIPPQGAVMVTLEMQ